MQGMPPGTNGCRVACSERGYAMAALLISIAIMSVMMAVALPVWSHMMQREREEEWIFRAEQYARAVLLFQRQYPGAFPTSVDALVKQKFLRKKYVDPLSADGEFRVVRPGQVLRPGQPPPGQPPRGRGGRESAGGGPFGRSGQQSRPSGQGGGQFQVGGQRGQTRTGADPQSGRGADRRGTRRQPGEDLDTSAKFVPGGIAGVSSKNTAASIKVFKGQTHYNDWIVTIEDVMPRFRLGGAPGSQTGSGQPRPGTRPGMPQQPFPGAGRQPQGRPGLPRPQ